MKIDKVVMPIIRYLLQEHFQDIKAAKNLGIKAVNLVLFS